MTIIDATCMNNPHTSEHHEDRKGWYLDSLGWVAVDLLFWW